MVPDAERRGGESFRVSLLMGLRVAGKALVVERRLGWL